jgi:hypothetical protein
MHVEVDIGLMTGVQKRYNRPRRRQVGELQSTVLTPTFLSELGASPDILRHNQLHQRLNEACRFLVPREPPTTCAGMQETHYRPSSGDPRDLARTSS